MFQKILVAIDDSQGSRNIFERSLTLATANRFSREGATPTELMLVHVLTLIDDFYPGDTFVGISESAMRMYAERLKIREQAGIEKLRSLASEATAAGITTEVILKMGDPGKMICEVAKAGNADLIVIGRRGLSGLSELLSGSTSNYVFHHAPCDVFTIQGIARAVPQPEIPTLVAGST